ncbi:phosphoribosylformylglycinamidine synthase I [bacterium]|nr:phosphoribosylformylglycinamidine synthase I [bacterium]
MTPKIAVILFPGTNCELEAMRALKRSDMDPKLIMWNDTETDYSEFDGFFLPGGFSYEDRGRSGVIASKNPLLDKIKKEAAKGKPVLGVCNGAQIILESKLIPGLDENHVEMALAWNKRIDKNGKILGTGFYNDWIYIKNAAPAGRSAFNKYDQNHVMRIPVAHAEGRYTTMDEELVKLIENNEQAVFKYCDKDGNIVNEFPVNPNGAILNLAGICNPEGNVMSLMPHPERTKNGQAIFDSMRDYVGKSFTITKKDSVVAKRETVVKDIVLDYKKPTFEILVDTVITDNEERTIEYAIKSIGFTNMKLKKQKYFGINLESGIDPVKTAIDLIESGELVNLAKEIPTIFIEGKAFDYEKEHGLSEVKSQNTNKNAYLTFDKEDTVGENILQTVKTHFSIPGVSKISSGKKWTLDIEQEKADEVIRTQILHNPHAMNIYKA